MTDAPSAKPIIRTQRLILRELRETDLAGFHQLYSSKDVMKYWSGIHDNITASHIHLGKMVSRPTNGEIAFAIVLPPTASNATSSTTPVATPTDGGTFIGYAGIWHTPTSELVFLIDQPYWSQGYMTEVLEVLMPMIWQKGVKRVWANVNSENEASLKLLRASGFIQCGTSVTTSMAGTGESLEMEATNPDDEGKEKEGDGGSDDDA